MQARLRTLRLRLLAMIFVVMAPLAAYIAIGARTTYETAKVALDTSQRDIGISIAIQLRAELTGVFQVMATLADATIDKSDCDAMVERTLRLNPQQAAIHIVRTDGVTCQALAQPTDPMAQRLAAALSSAAVRRPEQASSARTPNGLSTTVLTLGDKAYLLSAAGAPVEATIPWSGIVALDLGRFDRVLDALSLPERTGLAIIGEGIQPVVIRGGGSDWLPESGLARLPLDEPREKTGRDKTVRSYVRSAIDGTNFSLVAGFQSDRRNVVRQQFFALLLAPFATMLVIWAAYSHMIRRHVVHWTGELAETARRIAANRAARAPDNDAMPSELREVAQAFNMMIDGQAVRERSLEEALARNQHLARELHHRVKNSLQIVQSYLGLARRTESEAARRAVINIECRVNALSTAYRLALADGEMKDVPLDEYLGSVAGNIGIALQGPDQRIVSAFALKAKAPIDLATPLGLIIVEALIVLFADPALRTVFIDGTRDSEDRPILVIRGDIAPPTHSPDRLLLGLIQQAEAVQTPAADPTTYLNLVLPGARFGSS